MGVIFAIVVALIVGVFAGASIVVILNGRAEAEELRRIEDLDTVFSEDSYDFTTITKKLSLLSDRAQATFIFLYIMGISGNKKLLATMSRYLASATRGESTKEVALSRPSKKIKQ